MKRLIQSAIVITILAIILVSTGCNQSLNINQSPNSSTSENQSSFDNDNITGQSGNTTLTPEQQADIQRVIEEKKKLIDTGQIRFPSGYVMNVASGTIDENIYSGEKISNNDYYVIQFYFGTGAVDQDIRDLIQQSGCILYDPIPNCAYYVKIPPESLDTVISLVKSGKTRYLGHVPSEAKIQPELLAKMQTSPDETFEIAVHLVDEPDESQLNALGDIMQFYSHYYLILDTVGGFTEGNRIQDIANLGFVEWIEEGSTAIAD